MIILTPQILRFTLIFSPLICESMAKTFYKMNPKANFFSRFYHWLFSHIECLFWITAFIILFFLPENQAPKSLCPFTLLGLGHCPGCGIGHSIHYVLHGQFTLSFQQHPLGILAVIVIFMRIKQLIQPKKTVYETQPH